MKQAWLLTLTVLFIGLASCAHPIVPKTNQSHVVSYDGNVRSGGILRRDPSGGRVVTDSFKARYNELIDLYGDQFEPDLKPDVGIIKLKDNEWLIDKEHYIKALQMSQWKRDGRQPTGVFKKLIDKVT
jgi:hypothetical protein